MAALDDLKDAVNESTELWKNGQKGEALELLDQRITKARRENLDVWVKVLAMHASGLSQSTGDFESASRYCKQVLSFEPENALALFRMADVLRKQGKSDEAEAYAKRSHSLVAASDTKEGKDLLELLIKEWPQFGQLGA